MPLKNFKAPRDLEENKRFRAQLLQDARDNPVLQHAVIEQCRRNKLFAIDAFFWTLDPRQKRAVIPFILYPRQREFILWLDEMHRRAQTGENINGIVDKPRDVGATFTFMAWALCEWLFSDFSARVGSRKEDYVDKAGEQDTLFYKLDFQLNRLPPWLLPIGWRQTEHRGRMILTSPTGNGISGESANPDFSRGGRKSIVYFDELGFWDWAKSSWESAGETTNFRLAMSTPPESGRDSHFYKLLSGALGKVEVFNFEYSDVPHKTAEWLKHKKETSSEEEFAREVLKSYDSTTKGKVYAKDLTLVRLSDIDYNPHLPLFVSWDFGLDGTALIWWQKDFTTNRLYIVDSYYRADEDLGFFIPFVTGTIATDMGDSGETRYHYEPHELAKIRLHRDWSKTVTHFGDPDVKKTAVKDGESTRDWLEERGIYVDCNNWAGRTWMDIRNITKPIFRRLEINEERNGDLLSALRNAKYPERRENSQTTSKPMKPVHDWTSHLRSSFEYFADNEPDSPLQQIQTVIQSTKQNLHSAI